MCPPLRVYPRVRSYNFAFFDFDLELVLFPKWPRLLRLPILLRKIGK